jgi:hypothetical protein
VDSLNIDYRLSGSGWARCTVRFGDAQCEISASYLSDALGKLVLSAVAVLSGFQALSLGFDEEPGEYRWSITRVGADDISIRLLSFDRLWAISPMMKESSF